MWLDLSQHGGRQEKSGLGERIGRLTWEMQVTFSNGINIFSFICGCGEQSLCHSLFHMSSFPRHPRDWLLWFTAPLLGRLKAKQAFHVSSEHSFDGNASRMEGMGERMGFVGEGSG